MSQVVLFKMLIVKFNGMDGRVDGTTTVRASLLLGLLVFE